MCSSGFKDRKNKTKRVKTKERQKGKTKGKTDTKVNCIDTSIEEMASNIKRSDSKSPLWDEEEQPEDR